MISAGKLISCFNDFICPSVCNWAVLLISSYFLYQDPGAVQDRGFPGVYGRHPGGEGRQGARDRQRDTDEGQGRRGGGRIKRLGKVDNAKVIKSKTFQFGHRLPHRRVNSR